MANFPGSTPSFTGFTSSHTLSQDSHAAQHNLEQGEIVAIATKIGTGSSTPTAGMLLRGTGAGTSSWAQTNLTSDVTGVLPQANGGTGTTLATGTGKAVYDTSPTISGAILTGSPTLTTPVIASFSNSNHNHQNSGGGGTLTSAAIASLDWSLTTLKNPYKFSANSTTQRTTGNGAFAIMGYENEEYDTNNNYDNSTFLYTAPVSGFYHFSAQLNFDSASNDLIISFYKNGGESKRGDRIKGATSFVGIKVTSDFQLSAGDTIGVYAFGTNNTTDEATSTNNYFSGHLISIT